MSTPDIPAFPRTGVGNSGFQYDVPAQDGMSLRDYFAASALVGIIARQTPDEWAVRTHDQDAKTAYRFADSMLDARKRGDHE